jgi:hypothetical protein
LNRMPMALLLIFLGLVSGAYGDLKISVSTGDASGGSYYTESLRAEINDQISESTALSGSSLSQSFKGSGDKSETFSVTNNVGDHAEVGFDIKGSKSYKGSYTLSPENANYAMATEKLDVGTANSISAFGYAISRDKYENAELGLLVTKGFLAGYSNSAYATLGEATVKQNMKSASGESILVNEEAGKGLDYNHLDYFVGDYSEPFQHIAIPANCKLTSYFGSATATNNMAQKKRTVGSFSAPRMNWGSSAYNQEGDRIDSLIQITNGQLSKYSLTTTAIPAQVESIVMAGSANGKNIDVIGNSYNSEGDVSTTSTSITIGSLKGCSATTTANGFLSKASIGTSNANGGKITFKGEAKNAYGHTSDTLDIYTGKILNPKITASSTANFVASTSTSMNSATGSSIQDSLKAQNNGGDISTASTSITIGSLKGYSATTTANGLSSKASIGTSEAKGGKITFKGEAKNAYGLTSDTLDIYAGKILNPKITASSTANLVASTSTSMNSATGSSIQDSLKAQNNGGDISTASTSITIGSLKGYSAVTSENNGILSKASISTSEAKGSKITFKGGAKNAYGLTSDTLDIYTGKILNPKITTGSFANCFASTSTSMNSAKGSLIDLKSHAENKNRANEYIAYADGTTSDADIDYGGADFEVKAKSLPNTNLVTTASQNNVAITPTFSPTTSIKTAVMLEPMKNAFTKGGETDLGTTVFPALVRKGYATLRYVDSGASYDKFKNLGQYDVVLVNSHTGPWSIDLSTINPDSGRYDVTSSQLDYSTTKKSLVILAGCESLGGYPTKSNLAESVSKADLVGGYKVTVNTNWNADYLSAFFKELANGKTAQDANNYAYNTLWLRYLLVSHKDKLEFYGNRLYKL